MFLIQIQSASIVHYGELGLYGRGDVLDAVLLDQDDGYGCTGGPFFHAFPGDVDGNWTIR